MKKQQTFDHCRAIIFQEGDLVVIKRQKNGRKYCVFPGGTREGNETNEECLVRELKEELGIDALPKRLVYSYKRNGKTEGFYLVKWLSGEIHETDAEEYTWKKSSDNTYEQAKISPEDFAKENLMPKEVQDQLLKDLKKYGEDLSSRAIELEEKADIK